MGDTITVNIYEGRDAYQIAVANGFGGTRSEWLESLKGFPSVGTDPRGFYVSSSGSDSGSGRADQPWRTLEPLAGTTLIAGESIYLEGGVRHEGPLVINGSGTTRKPIRVRSFGSGRAVISGGVAVTGWTQIDAVRNIWSAPFAAATGRPRNLWIDGVRCVRPRKFIPTGITMTTTGVSTAASTLPGFLDGYGNPQDIELIADREWQEPRVPVDSVDGNEITIRPGALSSLVAMCAGVVGLTIPESLVAAENAYEIFEEAASTATFYHDRGTGTLYVIPPMGSPDPNLADVIAPVMEEILALDGQHDIDVSGVEFSHTTFLQPSATDGFVHVQSSAYWLPDGSYALPPGISAVTATDCQRVKITDCHFRSLGNAGGRIKGDASERCEVTGNLFEDVSDAAVIIGDIADVFGPESCIVSRNLIRKTGAEFTGAAAIMATYAQRLTVEFNTIYDVPYSGISVGWGWGTANNNTGFRVTGNRIYRCMTIKKDGGGIYSNGVQVDSVISGNYISDSGVTGLAAHDNYPAIYLDNGSTGILVEGNVAHSIMGGRVFLINGGTGNTFDANTVDAGSVEETSGATGNTIEAPDAVGIDAAEAAGIALNAGAVDLDLAHPDQHADDYRNGLLLEVYPADSLEVPVSGSMVRLVNQAGWKDLVQVTGASQPEFVRSAGAEPAYVRFEEGAEISAESFDRLGYDCTVYALLRVRGTNNFDMRIAHGTFQTSGVALTNYDTYRAMTIDGADGLPLRPTLVRDVWESWMFSVRQLGDYCRFALNGEEIALLNHPYSNLNAHPISGTFMLKGLGDGFDLAALRVYRRGTILSVPRWQRIHDSVLSKLQFNL